MLRQRVNHLPRWRHSRATEHHAGRANTGCTRRGDAGRGAPTDTFRESFQCSRSTTSSPVSRTASPRSSASARIHHRHLDPEARQEAIQNTTALAWRYFLNAARQGKHEREDVFQSLIWWACQHTKQGRQGGGASNAKCVLDFARRRKRNVVVQGGVDLNFLVGPTASVPDVVAFRLDVPAFLATLSERDRGISLDLAQGLGTTEVAKKWGVTPGAISQFRTRFKKKYDEFQVAI